MSSIKKYIGGDKKEWVTFGETNIYPNDLSNANNISVDFGECESVNSLLYSQQKDIEELKRNVSWLALHGGGGSGGSSGGGNVRKASCQITINDSSKEVSVSEGQTIYVRLSKFKGSSTTVPWNIKIAFDDQNIYTGSKTQGAYDTITVPIAWSLVSRFFEGTGKLKNHLMTVQATYKDEDTQMEGSGTLGAYVYIPTITVKLTTKDQYNVDDSSSELTASVVIDTALKGKFKLRVQSTSYNKFLDYDSFEFDKTTDSVTFQIYDFIAAFKEDDAPQPGVYSSTFLLYNENATTGSLQLMYQTTKQIVIFSSAVDLRVSFDGLSPDPEGDKRTKVYDNVKNMLFSFYAFKNGSTEYKYTISIFEHDNKYVLYFKGRFDTAEHFISTVYSNFSYVPYEGKIKQTVQSQFSKNSDKAYDSMLFARKEISCREMLNALKKYPDQEKEMFDSLAEGASMICLIGLFNPPRDKVNDGITECLEAGIGVRMVTSHETDNALATALNVDLISMEEYVEATDQLKEIKTNINEINAIKDVKSLPQPICLTGKDFTLLTGGMTKDEDGKEESGVRHLNDPKRFKRIVKNLKVITEASAEDKLLLVFGLQQIGKMVGVTGKSSLDEKIFRYSNLGIGLGVSGKEMTKEASDLILLDDSFNALVSALKYGRNINSCIRKYIQFSLTVSIVTYSIVIIGVLLMTDCPLGAAEIIWLNVIIDTFASIALLSEQPDELRYHKEKKSTGKLITSFMKVTILSQSLYEIAILIIILVFGDDIFGIMTDWNFRHISWNQTNGYHFTLFFTVLIYFQVCNSINCRKINKNQKNVFSGLIAHYHFILYEVLLILIHLYLVSFGGKGLRVKPLSFVHHLVCLGFAATCLLVDLIIKLIKYKEKKVHKKVKKEEDNEEDLVLLANVIQNVPQKVFKIGDWLHHTKVESI